MANTAVDVSASMDDLRSRDKERQNRAFQALSEMTADPVEWAYEVWDELMRLVKEGDNRQRSIAGQLLCNLAKSDPEGRILNHAPALIELTRDERFVTARHCLLSLWKIAILEHRRRTIIVDGLGQRFRECLAEKNCTLIRYDIQCVLKRIYDHAPDEKLRSVGEKLISEEENQKYRRKYSAVWRSLPSPDL